MKYLASLLFLLFLVIPASSQPLPPSALKTGISMTGYSREAEQTPSILIALNKDFYPRTAIEVSAEWALPHDYQIEFETGEIQSIRLGLSILYKVIEGRNQLLHLGLGFSAGLYDLDFTEDFGNISTQTQRTDLYPGFMVLAEYHYVLPNDLFIGARASTFRYDADRSGWSLGLVGGLRF
jgi:hypothetical protein